MENSWKWSSGSALSFALGPRWIDPLFDDVAQEVPSDQSGHEKLHLHVGVKPGEDSGRSHDGEVHKMGLSGDFS